MATQRDFIPFIHLLPHHSQPLHQGLWLTNLTKFSRNPPRFFCSDSFLLIYWAEAAYGGTQWKSHQVDSGRRQSKVVWRDFSSSNRRSISELTLSCKHPHKEMKLHPAWHWPSQPAAPGCQAVGKQVVDACRKTQVANCPSTAVSDHP